MTEPQSFEAVMNHAVVGEVSGCSLCAVTQPFIPGIFSRLWLHMGKGIIYQTPYTQPRDDRVFVDVQDVLNVHVLSAKFIVRTAVPAIMMHGRNISSNIKLFIDGCHPVIQFYTLNSLLHPKLFMKLKGTK